MGGEGMGGAYGAFVGDCGGAGGIVGIVVCNGGGVVMLEGPL